jgi:hypothetical protein
MDLDDLLNLIEDLQARIDNLEKINVMSWKRPCFCDDGEVCLCGAFEHNYKLDPIRTAELYPETVKDKGWCTCSGWFYKGVCDCDKHFKKDDVDT